MAKVGRPRKYETPEELQIAIDKYFAEGISLKKVVTGPPNKRGIEEIAIPSIVELALWLGFESRQSIWDYAHRNEDETKEFAYLIKNAISRIEAWNEVNLLAGNSTGSIFWLKNHGWRDEKSFDVKATGKIEIVNFAEIQQNDTKQAIL